MRVNINSNVLTVVTDIPAAVVERGIADLTARDEKGNPIYKVAMNKDGNGSLSQYGLSANSIVDGKLAVVIVEELGYEKDDFIKKYGKSVVAATKYCPVIAEAAASEEELIRAAFE